jgi:4-azaleucine resistance transporter AzlC
MTRSSYGRDALVIGAATGVFGAAFGVLAAATGLSLAKTMALSLLVFTGASQFAAVGVVGSSGGEVTAVASALLLAARNGFYGIALARHLRARLLGRAAAAQLVIDESTALAMAQVDPDDRERAFLACGLSVFGFWNLGTALGALGGEAIGDPGALGLDAAFPAGFIALAAPAFGHRRGLVAAGVGAVVALVATPLVRPGVPILLAAIGAVVALAVPAPESSIPVEAEGEPGPSDGSRS